MTDVFISYAGSDRERARAIANALSERGCSVWWDRKIKAGQTFDEAIERELELAKNIVVLWSESSVASEWVKNEAAVAAQRGVLIPALLDNVKVPLEFRRRQTVDLIGWDGDPSHGGFQTLLEALESRQMEVAKAPAAASPVKVRARQFFPWLAAGAAGLVLGCVLTYVALSGPRSSDNSGAGTRDLAAGGASSAPAAGTWRPVLPGSNRQRTETSLPTNLATSDKAVFLDVVAFAKAGELTSVEWIIRNTSDQRMTVCSHASLASLIDQTTGESWRALHTGGPAAGCQTVSAGGQSGAWAKFKLASLENRRLSLSLPVLLNAPELPQISTK